MSWDALIQECLSDIMSMMKTEAKKNGFIDIVQAHVAQNFGSNKEAFYGFATNPCNKPAITDIKLQFSKKGKDLLPEHEMIQWLKDIPPETPEDQLVSPPSSNALSQASGMSGSFMEASGASRGPLSKSGRVDTNLWANVNKNGGGKEVYLSLFRGPVLDEETGKVSTENSEASSPAISPPQSPSASLVMIGTKKIVHRDKKGSTWEQKGNR
eukprot:g9223.t1